MSLCLRAKRSNVAMKHMKLLGVLLVVAFALSAVAAGAAFAAEPEYLVKLSPFTGTKAVEAEANGVQTLKSTGLTIECKKFGLAAGAVIEGGAPGKSKETIQYSECAVAGFALCKIFETASLT